MRSTDLIHHPYTPPAEFAAPAVGVHKASTVIFPNVAAMRTREWKDKSAYTYGLHGTPTTFTLEERLCTLEGARQCLLVPSGLAAIANVSLSLLRSGDHVLLPDNVYGPNRALTEGELAQYGITHGYYDPMRPDDLAAQLQAHPQTRLVWLEAAGSCTLEFPDLAALVALCRAHGATTALDNTWGAGLAFNPFDFAADTEPNGARLGVDLTVHALTKYPSGGGDVLMGGVFTCDPSLHLRLKLTHMRLGLGVAANDAELVLRSLPTVALRYAAHDASARAIAHWLTRQPWAAQTLHPALPGSPGHVHWQRVCDPTGSGQPGRAAGLVSVLIQPEHGQARVDAFCDALRLFKLGYSWGGPMSLVVPYALAGMRSRWPTGLARGTLVRLSTGLEDADDLIADLAQAAQRAF